MGEKKAYPLRISAPVLDAMQRWANDELRSLNAQIEYILRELPILPTGAPAESVPALRPNHLSISLVEGWRGEICHVAITDRTGKLAAYKVVDPSFHNWPALAMVLRGQQVSDFPLCNKSFNLSYSGHDL